MFNSTVALNVKIFCHVLIAKKSVCQYVSTSYCVGRYSACYLYVNIWKD